LQASTNMRSGMREQHNNERQHSLSTGKPTNIGTRDKQRSVSGGTV